ncbi:MAG: redoxin domain-containing protein [Bacteroidota bacterium]
MSEKKEPFNLAKFIKKQWSNILFVVFVILLLIPQTRMPIQVFVNRLNPFSASTIAEDKRDEISSYNWSLVDRKQQAIDFNRSKSKVVLINFWGSWCPPCVAEMPELQELYDDYGDKVDFYFVAHDKEKSVEKFMQKHQYDFPVFYPINDPPNPIAANSLPTTYVISKSGEIVVEKTGYAKWNSDKTRNLLDELLAE